MILAIITAYYLFFAMLFMQPWGERLEKGWTQAELARKLNVKQSTTANINYVCANKKPAQLSGLFLLSGPATPIKI